MWANKLATIFTAVFIGTILLPEVDSRCALVNVCGRNTTDAALGEEDADERGIVAARPVLHGERQRVRVMRGWV